MSMVIITEETVQHVQLLLEMEAAAKVARPSEGKPCSELTLEEELARMRFYKLVTPSGIMAIANLVRLLERAANDNEPTLPHQRGANKNEVTACVHSSSTWF